VQIRREHKGALEVFPLGPKRQAAFLASGQVSGVAGGKRLDPSQLRRGEENSVAMTAGTAPGASNQGGGEGLVLVNPVLQKRAVPVAGIVQADILLEWRHNPSGRVLTCTVELAQDAQLRNVLARYNSANMSLLIKGMRPGVYHWRTSCDLDGQAQSSPVGRIVVADGRPPSRLPVLLGPANRSKLKTQTVDFLWDKADGAKFYVVQLSRDPNFKKMNEYLAKKGTGLRMNLKQKGTYYWRVYGVLGDSKEQRTPFSSVYSFTY